MGDLEKLKRLVETWSTQKRQIFKRNPYAGGTNAASLKEFTETLNRITRMAIREFEIERDLEFYISLSEICMNAERFLVGGKLFVDKEDVTQKGM